MRFGQSQNQFFRTSEGAYSQVTDRERFDSQITVTDFEAEIIINYFSDENILVGNVSSDRETASKRFLLFPDSTPIQLNLVYPKPGKGELRLYLSERAGFRPDGGDVWFVYERAGDLWIGSLDETSWRFQFSEARRDENDGAYQQLVNDDNEVRIHRIAERDVYTRNRQIALNRFEIANYSCEYDPGHELFVSRFSGRSYLEAHHLVPMGLQEQFQRPLDTVENVFALCPNCHRVLHHAENHVAREWIGELATRRDLLTMYDLNIEELFGLYGVENIV